MTASSPTRLFEQGLGRQRLPHTVIIARGERVRHFTVRPFLLALSASLLTLAVAATVGSAGYLLLHDEIRAAGASHQDRMNEAYEERIATLRTQLDRTTSRQLLDQERVATKVDLLLDQQGALAARYDRLKPLLENARTSGLLAEAPAPAGVPVPEPKPAVGNAGLATAGALEPLPFAEVEGSHPALARFDAVDPAHTGSLRQPSGEAKARVTPEMVEAIGRAMDKEELRQIGEVDLLSRRARTKAAAIASVLRTEGLPVAAAPNDDAAAGLPEGGPFVPVPSGGRFDAEIADLAAALDSLKALRAASAGLPLGQPVASTAISSTFGIRPDPFLGRSAMHTGIDFVAATGTSVRATAPGRVVTAGEAAGYGLMVEIDHGNGLSTRYGHLSQVLVSVGDAVAEASTIGRVGSTGRSTGPHLHYEIRRTGDAVDPSRYLRAGRRIAAM